MITRTLSSTAPLRKNISKLQKDQNLLARVVFNTHQSNSHTLLQQLHWLSIEYRINLKIANITFNSILCITYSLHIYIPSNTFALMLIP